MQFVYNNDAGNPNLLITNQSYNHLFKSRRQKKVSLFYFRNLSDSFIYTYKVLSIDKRSATLSLIETNKSVVEPLKKLHIGWCIVDPSDIEKTLPYLNEIGVSKITFIYCDNSQKHYIIDYDRLNRILINSSEQSGRSSIITLCEVDSLDKFYKLNPNTKMLNFSNQIIDSASCIDTIIVGCEGGFSDRENLLDIQKVGFHSSIILRSVTAVSSIASKLLL